MNQSLVLDFASIASAPFDAGLGVSLITFKQPPVTLTETGAQPALSDYTNISGLVNIQCMDAPEMLGSSFSSWEKQSAADIASVARRHVLLNGYYSQLSPSTNWGDAGWIAVVTNTVTGQSQTYDLRGAEADSQQSQTRVLLQRATV